MKTICKIAVVILMGSALRAGAQVAPEATSPGSLGVSGTLTYAARYSHMIEYYSGQSGQMASISGNFGYATTSKHYPFSVNFGAGDSWTLTGPSFDTGPYENLNITQNIVGHKWSLDLNDDVSYFQGTPITGYAGAPGTGAPIGQPSTTPQTQTILTLNTVSIGNYATAQYNYQINGSSTVSAGGGSELLRYPNGDGIDTNGVLANAQWTQVLDARNSLIGAYSFAQFTFSDVAFTMDTNSPTIGWQRTWTRSVTSFVSAGPQWISSSLSSYLPSTLGVSINATVTDSTKIGSANAMYSHGFMGGAGYMYGGVMDTVSGGFNRTFGSDVASQYNLSLSSGYYRNAPIDAQQQQAQQQFPIAGIDGTITGVFGSGQVTRNLGRYFSAYANYTGSTQSTGSAVPGNVLTTLWQVISFGIGFTPQPLQLRH